MQCKFFKLFFGVLIGCLSIGVQAEQQFNSAILLPQAENIKPFSLKWQPDVHHKNSLTQFTHANLTGQWTLLFFGFTHCPALCPTTMAQLAAAYQQLQNQQFTPLPQVVFVSVDPEQDSVAQVAQFAQAFNKNFIGLQTPNKATLAEMTHEMDAMFEKVPVTKNPVQNSSGAYTIDHTGDIKVINPEGKFVAMLTMPHQADDIVVDYKAIVKNSTQSRGLADRIKSIF
jgi:protein SCO1/2